MVKLVLLFLNNLFIKFSRNYVLFFANSDKKQYKPSKSSSFLSRFLYYNLSKRSRHRWPEKEKTFINEKMADGRHDMKKGRNSKGQIIYGSLYGKSYREVREKKINSIVKLPVAKTISPSESMNICDVSTRWLESIRHTVKESTYSCYLTLIQKHILTYFNNSSMITSEHIQQFINYKITNDLSLQPV